MGPPKKQAAPSCLVAPMTYKTAPSLGRERFSRFVTLVPLLFGSSFGRLPMGNR